MFIFYLYKWAFSIILCLFQTNFTITQNINPFRIWCWDSNPQPLQHESPPKTTNNSYLRPLIKKTNGLDRTRILSLTSPSLNHHYFPKYICIAVLLHLFFSHPDSNTKYLKLSVDFAIGNRTLDRRMVGRLIH